MSGLSNIDIETFFLKESNEDLKNSFKKVVSSDSLTKYIQFRKILADGKSHYPFIIMNTARKNQKGVHWWSILNIDKKNIYFYLIVKDLKVLNTLFYQTIAIL